jgi:hypothetical protein
MKTGFDLTSDTSEQINQYTQAMIDIVTPVLEKGMILACEYSKACGRNAVLMKDLEYSMKYCARYEVGQRVGSYFPDLDDDDDDANDIDVIDESGIEFTRYTGDDPGMNKINEAYDTWDSWVPTNPTEELLKNAIDSNGQ